MSGVPTEIAAGAVLPEVGGGVRAGVAELLARTPVRVEVGDEVRTRVVRIAAVVPCHNRRADAEAVLGDLARVELEVPGSAGTECRRTRIDLRVLLVDNASTVPLATIAAPEGLRLEHLRSDINSGGSGGYNAGMARVLSSWADDADGWDPAYVWLVDSDARVGPATLARLLEVMERDEAIVAAGSAICDPLTGQAFELGGNQNTYSGHFEPMVLGVVGVCGGDDGLVDCDYVAACCALVRAEAIRATGLFPDRFLNADDVEWFIRMKQVTGGRVVGVPASLAMHPRFDRFPTWTRYYMCRNAFGPLEAVGGGVKSRAIRATRETMRAVQQAIMGRMDLARLHVRALQDAAAARTIGPAGPGVIAVEPARPWGELGADLERELGAPARGRGGASAWVLNDLQIGPAAEREMRGQLARAGLVERWPTPRRERGLVRSLLGAGLRWLAGPRAEVAVVPARGRPSAWFAGRLVVQGTPQGYVLRRTRRVRTAVDAAGVLLVGGWHAVRCARRRAEFRELPAAPKGPASPAHFMGGGEDGEVDQTLPRLATIARPVSRAQEGEAREMPRLRGVSAQGTLTVVVLSFNRWEALAKTLRALHAEVGAGVLVVDNGSTDGTPERVRAEFPSVRVIALGENVGVEAFNRAVAAVESELVLILDDDAVVPERALHGAVQLLARRPDLAAVTFVPRHPRTGRGEWSFAERDDTAIWSDDRWPVMGCANLVRRKDWLTVGGYERDFFLYRNDTDLAMKLLAAGRGVHMNSSWIALHDTSAGAGERKSARWHLLATRNWVWVCKRHGRGVSGVLAAMAGWAWAHRLAGLSPSRQWATALGGLEGVFGRAPALPEGVEVDGRHLRRLVGLRRGVRGHRRR